MKFFSLLIALCTLLVCRMPASAQQLVTDGDFNGSGAGWTTACTSVEAYAYETTYGGTDPTNHVAEIDDEACMYQDVCVLPGCSYTFSMDASRRTTGSAPGTVTTHINIVGLDASSGVVATYVDMDFSRSNTTFGFVAVAGIPTITVPCGSGVVYLKITLTDNSPGYSTFGMVVDNISLVFVTPPSIIGPGTLCQGLPGTFGVSGGCSTGMTYAWDFTGGTPATSAVAAPAVSWAATGTYPVSVALGNGTCTVLTANGSADVLARVTATIHDTGCYGLPVVFRGTTFTTSGTYTVTVHNPGGCDSIITLILYIRPAITGDLNASICTGGSYTIAGNTYTTAGDHPAGTYTSRTGCDSVVTLHLTINPIPVPPVVADSPGNYCPGQLFVPFVVSSGTGILWYYAATGGAGTTTAPVLATTTPGEQTVWASQTVLGCESPRVPVSIFVYDQVVPNFTYNLIYGCSADTVIFTNTSANTTYYKWEFGDGYSSDRQSPTHVYAQGTDVVTLYAGANSCVDSVKQTISHIHPLHAAFSTDSLIICQGHTITFTDLSVATTPKYLWLFGDGNTASTASTAHTYPNSGVYKVMEVVSDFIPCYDTAYQTVSIDSNSPISIHITDPILCEATYATFSADYSTIGNTGIVWNFGNGDSVLGNNPVISYAYNTPGVFNITATAEYRICPNATAYGTITIEPQPTVDLGPDKSICKGSDIMTLADIAPAPYANATWLWSTGETTPAITVNAPGTYTATITVKGCSASSSIKVINDCYMNIPNVFSPNGDGLNDYFLPRQYLSSGLISFGMHIYNRWGQEIFECTSLDGRGWDGKFNGVDQPGGVYVYVIDGTFKDGQKEHHQGNVTLLR